MQKNTTLFIVIGFVVLIAIGAVVSIVNRSDKNPVSKWEGEIVSINHGKRIAECKFQNPKDPTRTFLQTAEIPQNCEITLNGQPIQLRDVRVGDTIIVEAVKVDDRRIPRSVRVKRFEDTPTTTTQPTSQP